MDDIYYLIHVIPRGTYIRDAYDIKTRKQAVQYDCDDFIANYGGVLKTNPHGYEDPDELESSPGVYTTIIHKYNINKIHLFYGIPSACVLILSKTLLLQNNYHINQSTHYGQISDVYTFFPWELKKFIRSQKDASEWFTTLPTNETVFHGDIDLHKYCCDVVPIQHFRHKVGAHKPIKFDNNEVKYVATMPQYLSYKYVNNFPTFICEKGEPDMTLKPNYSNAWIDKRMATDELSDLIKHNRISALKKYTSKRANIFNKIKTDIGFVYSNLQQLNCSADKYAQEYRRIYPDAIAATNNRQAPPRSRKRGRKSTGSS